MSEHKKILNYINEDEEKSFKFLYDNYFDTLTLFSNQLVNDPETAEDIVQDFFTDLWVRNSHILSKDHLDAYLFQSVKYASLRYIRDQRRQKNRLREKIDVSDEACETELTRKVDIFERVYKAINALPPERKKIFMMVYIEGLKHQEVAEQLKISINTVKTQVLRGLKYIRQCLSDIDYYTFLFFLKKIPC